MKRVQLIHELGTHRGPYTDEVQAWKCRDSRLEFNLKNAQGSAAVEFGRCRGLQSSIDLGSPLSTISHLLRDYGHSNRHPGGGALMREDKPCPPAGPQGCACGSHLKTDEASSNERAE